MGRFLKLLKLILILGGITLIIVSLVYYFTQGPPSRLLSPLADDGPTILNFFSRRKDPAELKQDIQELVGDDIKNYSVLVEDYNSNFRMEIGENVIYEAASVNKIPILAALYYFNQKGEVNLDQVITLQANDIQDYGTGVIRYDPPGTPYSVKTLTRLMMQKSDNTAAYLLANYVLSIDKIQTLMNSWGMTQTDMINNKTSNHDMAILLRKLYSGKLTNQALTGEMLDFMKDSDYEDRIPALLPKGTNVYHKIGNVEGGLHDVGIVNSGNTKYYLGIFTADITDEASTTKLMAQISKTVYDYLR